MKDTRERLCKTVDKAIKKHLTFKDYVTNTRKIAAQIKETYNIPVSYTTDYLSGKRSLDEADSFMLFALLNSLEPGKIFDFFTEKDYNKFSVMKYQPETIKFPLEIPAVQIAEDQWMCVVDAKLLMKFRDAQLIEYNENTQRTLTRAKSSGVEYYKITLNKKAVRGIKESLTRGNYIPNTITLNLPEGTDFDYSLDKNAIVIESLDHFDIIDGYHRYIAISEIYNDDPDFNYNMELRLVAFREEKARQFIWQEDQKTKMSKVDSESFNQYKLSNTIVNRICSGPYGKIIKSKDGIIDAAILSNVLDSTYIKHISRATRSEELRIAKNIEEDLNKLEEQDPTIYDTRWNREFTICVIYCLWRKIYDLKEIRVFSRKASEEISTRLNNKDIMRLNATLEVLGYVQ